MKKCFITPFITGVALFVLFVSSVFPGMALASEILPIEVSNSIESTAELIEENLPPSSNESEENPEKTTTTPEVLPLTSNSSPNQNEIIEEANQRSETPQITNNLESTQQEIPEPSCNESSAEDCYEEDNDYSDEELALLNSDDSHDMDLLKNFEGVIRQSNEYSCGPAALATLLTQMGYASSESQIEELAPPNSEVGVSLFALKAASIFLGYETRLKKWSMGKIKSRILETGNPILIHDIKPNVGGHFSVVREFENGQVVVSDTEAGNITMSEEDFSKIITGYVLIIVEESDDPLLSDFSDEVSDEEAKTITGKYVAVMSAALQEGGDAKKYALEFNNCMNEALKIGSSTKRQSARVLCYENFEKNLRKNLTVDDLQEVMDNSESTYITSKPTNQNQTYEWYETSVVYMNLKKQISDAETKLADIKVSVKKETDLRTKKISELNAKIAPLKVKINLNNSLKQPFQTKLTSKKSLLETVEKSLGQVKLKLGDLDKSISSATTGLNKLSSATLKKMQNAEKNIITIKNNISLKEKDLSTKKSNLKITETSIKTTESLIKTKKLFRKSYTTEQSLLTSLQGVRKKLFSEISQLERDLSSLKVSLSENELASKNPNLLLLNSANEQKRLKLEEKTRYEQQIATLKNEVLALEKSVKKYDDATSPFLKDIGVYEAEILKLNSEIKAWSDKIREQQNLISTLNKDLKAEMDFMDKMELSLQKDLNNYLDYYVIYDLVDFSVSTAIFVKDVGVATVEAGKVCLMGTNFSGSGIGGTNRFQNCLDACGTVDISGPVAMACDATNGTIYLFKGDKVMAGAYAFAVIPVAGLVTKNVVKQSSNLATEALQKEVKKAVKEAEEKIINETLNKSGVVVGKYNLKVITKEVQIVSETKFQSYSFKVERNFEDIVKDFNAGKLNKRGIYKNNTEPYLPIMPDKDYYTEYEILTKEYPNSTGPERLITGKNGELYYTPDHYTISFLDLLSGKIHY